MAAVINKYTFILDTVRAALAVDTALMVVPVWQAEQTVPTARTLVYVNIINDSTEASILEDARSANVRSCTLGIIARFIIPTTKAGNADNYYGDVAERIAARLDALDTTLAQAPLLGTSPRYATTLHVLQRRGSSGFISDGTTDGTWQQEIVIMYTEVPL